MEYSRGMFQRQPISEIRISYFRPRRPTPSASRRTSVQPFGSTRCARDIPSADSVLLYRKGENTKDISWGTGSLLPVGNAGGVS